MTVSSAQFRRHCFEFIIVLVMIACGGFTLFVSLSWLFALLSLMRAAARAQVFRNSKEAKVHVRLLVQPYCSPACSLSASGRRRRLYHLWLVWHHALLSPAYAEKGDSGLKPSSFRNVAGV